MEKINLIVAAMEVELNALLNEIAEYEEIKVKGETLYRFERNNKIYYAGLGKIGKVHTAVYLAKMIESLDIERIFNIGTSGGIRKDLTTRDVIIATKVGYYDVDVTDFNYKLGQMCGCPQYFDCDNEYIKNNLRKSELSLVEGIVLSGDTFMNREKYLKSNLVKFDDEILACEMESGAVGQVCYIYNIPFVVIRSISDIVTRDNNNFEEHVSNANETSTNSAKALLQLI